MGGAASADARGVFLSWTKSARRSDDLADVLGLTSRRVAVGRQRKGTAPFRWFAQGVLSMPALLQRRHRSIVLMLPPYPALVLCQTVARIRRIPLVVDVHSAVIEDPKWRRFLPATLKRLARCDLAIVTNAIHRDLLEEHGVPVTELHNPPEPVSRTSPIDAHAHVLVPASWHADEPITEIVEAARAHPERQFVITGRPAPEVVERIEPLPANVRLTGFVSDAEYAELLDRAALVCCLTLNDNTMQLGGYEALGLGTPLLTSDFGLLRSYFGDAAVYSAPDAESISDAVAKVAADHDGYAARMIVRRDELAESFRRSLEPVRAALDPSCSGAQNASSADEPAVGSGS